MSRCSERSPVLTAFRFFFICFFICFFLKDLTKCKNSKKNYPTISKKQVGKKKKKKQKNDSNDTMIEAVKTDSYFYFYFYFFFHSYVLCYVWVCCHFFYIHKIRQYKRWYDDRSCEEQLHWDCQNSIGEWGKREREKQLCCSLLLSLIDYVI